MAIYHFSMQVISRKNNRSAVFAAAYRAGEKLIDQRLDKVADYTKKRRPLHTEIFAPPHAPAWVYNRERLWNAVEAREKRKDAQLAREFNVALPAELSTEQQIELMRRYVQEQFVNRGMVADISINKPPKRGSKLNFYAHVMLTTRFISLDGFGGKNREWNSPSLLKEWRAGWAQYANAALAKAGRAERIDHRSLQAQGYDREPTIHLGPDQGDQAEKTDRNCREERNRQVIALNKERAVRLASRLTTPSRFRSTLLEVYNRQCAITGFDVVQALEAAQIYPYYKKGKTYKVENGLLLRADIHKLFDLYQIAVHPETMEVSIAPELEGTGYGELNGKKLRLPEDKNLWPDRKMLERHYKQFQQSCTGRVKDSEVVMDEQLELELFPHSC
jgi:hypothetical protein